MRWGWAQCETHKRIKFRYQCCGEWDGHLGEMCKTATAVSQAVDETWESEYRGKEEIGPGGEDCDEELEEHWGELLGRRG